jgi:hypothetical protein
MLDPKDILTPEELAKRLKVSPSWIYERTRVCGRYAPRILPPLCEVVGGFAQG